MTAKKTSVRITEGNYEELVTKGTVILDFWASWCGPCRAFAPTFEAAAGRHPGVLFGKVNTEEEPRLAAAFGVRAIPTVVVMRDDVVLYAEPGVLNAPSIDSLLEKVQSLDMNEVRRKLDEEERGAGA